MCLGTQYTMPGTDRACGGTRVEACECDADRYLVISPQVTTALSTLLYLMPGNDKDNPTRTKANARAWPVRLAPCARAAMDGTVRLRDSTNSVMPATEMLSGRGIGTVRPTCSISIVVPKGMSGLRRCLDSPAMMPRSESARVRRCFVLLKPVLTVSKVLSMSVLMWVYGESILQSWWCMAVLRAMLADYARFMRCPGLTDRMTLLPGVQRVPGRDRVHSRP